VPTTATLSLHDALDEIERLKVLVEASKLINSSLEPGLIYEAILHVAREQLGVERGTLYFLDEAKGEIWAKVLDDPGVDEIHLPLGQGIAGSVAQSGEVVLLEDARSDPRFDGSMDLRTGFRTDSMLCVPVRNRRGKTVGVLQLLNKTSGPFTNADVDFLGSVSEHLAIAIENATLQRDLLDKQRMERELRLGRDIQARLLPSPPRGVPGAVLAARSRPCYEVGGDCYDFIPLPGGELGLAIADVSGKGVSAALIMSSVQTALRMAAPIEPSLPALFGSLNRMLLEMTSGKKFVTLFFGRYQPATGTLRWANAGHVPPFVVSDGAPPSPLPGSGPPLGLLKEVRHTEHETVLPPRSTLVLYTDGLDEATNPQDQQLGVPALSGIAASLAGLPAEEAVNELMAAVLAFEDGAPPSDDKTAVVLARQD
jgi:sigma-B regulation protein RsbU (phosphoserine phosphatase)